jgi:hypothetical protein
VPNPNSFDSHWNWSRGTHTQLAVLHGGPLGWAINALIGEVAWVLLCPLTATVRVAGAPAMTGVTGKFLDWGTYGRSVFYRPCALDCYPAQVDMRRHQLHHAASDTNSYRQHYARTTVRSPRKLNLCLTL